MRSFTIKYLIIPLLFPNFCFGQITDSFDNGELDAKTWQGDFADFKIDEGRLRLDAPIDKGRSMLYTELRNLPEETQWDLDINMNFNPSSQNFLHLWFISDNLDLDNASGYHISIGETGSDDAIIINQMVDGESFPIASGIDGAVAAKPNVSIRIKRQASGNTVLSAAHSDGDQESIKFSTELPSSGYFIIDCNYTSTRADEFFFDNFYVGDIIVDTQVPSLINSSVLSDEVNLTFSEVLDLSSSEKTNFSFSPQVDIKEVKLESNGIDILVADAFEEGVEYEMKMKNIIDLEGNQLDTSIIFSILPRAQRGDILINEILFNPRGSGSDYVEIVNTSDRTISLSELYIGNVDNGGRMEILFPNQIQPGEFLVFTEDKENIIDEYPTHNMDNIYEQDLPSFNNDDGNVSIARMVDGEIVLIDGYDYSEKDHFALLDEEDGVSLERVDLDRESNDKSNWTSAASTVGFGTPGLENSASGSSNSPIEEMITVTNKVFSPNGDGSDDKAELFFSLPSPFVANATIYDISGREIRKLWNNETISTSGVLTWDGLNNNQASASEGIYVIVFEIFNLEGRVIRHKEELVLAER